MMMKMTTTTSKSAAAANHPLPDPRSCPLGDVWTSHDDLTDIRSIAMDDNDTTELALCFRNQCKVPLRLCWMDEDGQAHHFYRLEPCSSGRGQGATPTHPVPVVTVDDWIEQTQLGQAFVVLADGSDENQMKSTKQQQPTLEGFMLVGGYRPRILQPKTLHKGETADDSDDDDYDDEHPIHVIEIFAERETNGSPSLTNLRGATVSRDVLNDPGPRTRWYLHVTRGKIDPTPIDTTSKPYMATTLGGWPVFLDSEWPEAPPTYRELLERDLQQLCRLLPPHAVKYLQGNTPLWVNCSFQYGPQACPIDGEGCCFHPDVDWLMEHGCHAQKVECVELYNLEKEYQSDYLLWGPGGVLVHEFSHAYHFKCLPGGYDNPQVLECYRAAMEEGLYDEVEVHDDDNDGDDGDGGKVKRKAYACHSAMEYFAELSTAFLGGLDHDAEYNKWYPFNRQQVKEHDPRMYSVLKKVWKVKIDDEDNDDDDDDEKENGKNK